MFHRFSITLFCRYLLEIQRLEEERKLLRAERERFSQDFEVKLRRAESLFESELTAAKIMYTRELQALREHEEALKDELAARQVHQLFGIEWRSNPSHFQARGVP
jgi:hypothetical protein